MERLKEKATALSKLLMSEIKDMPAIHSLIEEFKIPSSKILTIEKELKEKKSANNDRVGIWEKKTINGRKTFQRDTDKRDEWHSWADEHEIPIKSDKKRVVLIGESVAKGFFYAPRYSVAKELEFVLKASHSFNEIEVIDLAKSSIEMDELASVVSSCPLLNPDYIVLFAGNNWINEYYDKLSLVDFKELWAVYKEGQFLGLKSFLEKIFESVVEDFFEILLKTIRCHKIPCTIVVPGFNLMDWKSDEILQCLTFLPEGHIEQWIDARGKAEIALAKGDYDRLEAESKQMIELDISNPLGHEFLAKSYIKKGRISEAIRCLDEAKDTTMYGRALTSAPRCYKAVRDTIIKKASQEKIPVVNLFEIFNKENKNGVTGKEFYLDYCHLSADGIKLSMRHVAKEIIENLANKKIKLTSIPESGIYPDNFTTAIAHFSAAIHNAHWSQSKAILDFHCQKSISADMKVKDVMLQFVDFTSRKTPNILCSSFENLVLDGNMSQYEGGMALLHERRKKLMDLELVDAIVKALKSIGLNYEAKVNRFRILEYGIAKKPLNLLESFYHLNGYNSYNTRQGRNFLQIRNKEKEFRFFSNGNQDLVVEMCYRNPISKKLGQHFWIYLNGRNQRVKNVQTSIDWKNVRFEISKNLLEEGLNKLIIQWPVHHDYQEFNENNMGLILNDVFFPVIAEIYSLSIANLNSDK
ncbi:tetratricopeptide repeat protein [Maribacter sp. 2307UL18-2]|uniref:tetratricopeptide repeat protein n=1 Tax=Maribacter sp. 2307UL18-2 TaxID=3386274 RepID=UPI0039BCE8CE